MYRLSDGLCGNDSDSLSDLNRFSGRHVGAVALGAYAVFTFTGQDRTDLHFLKRISVLVHTILHHFLSTLRCDHMICFDNNIALFIFDVLAGETSCDTLLQTLDFFISVHECFDIHARDLFAGTLHAVAVMMISSCDTSTRRLVR